MTQEELERLNELCNRKMGSLKDEELRDLCRLAQKRVQELEERLNKK